MNSKNQTSLSEKEKEILRERAKKLSVIKISDEEDSKQIEIVVFDIADEQYAFETKFIKEVYVVKDIIPIPNVPGFIIGLINVRGEIISVVDIKSFFGMEQKGVTNLNQVVILENSKMKFGVLADIIVGTRTISKKDIQESIPTFDTQQLKYFNGITSDGVILLDANKILSDESLIVNEKIIS